MTLKERCEKGIVVLDGAMGTMIQEYKFSEEDFCPPNYNPTKPLKGNNDLLALAQPEILAEIHAKYFEAGSDMVETNTFSGTTIAQADYACEDLVYDINFHSARIAKEVAEKFTKENPDKPRYVAGAVGPTNRTASISPDVNNPGYRATSFDELKIAYKQQVKALIEGGVDAILIETIFDTLNAKAAIFATQEAYDELGKELPIMISGTITDASGRTLSGQTTEAFLISVSHAPLLSVGLNCALGPDEMIPYLRTLKQKSPFITSAYPNAGLPNEMGEYDLDASEMGKSIKQFLDENLVGIIGGCCGTTPDHIREMVRLVELAKSEKA